MIAGAFPEGNLIFIAPFSTFPRDWHTYAYPSGTLFDFFANEEKQWKEWKMSL